MPVICPLSTEQFRVCREIHRALEKPVVGEFHVGRRSQRSEPTASAEAGLVPSAAVGQGQRHDGSEEAAQSRGEKCRRSEQQIRHAGSFCPTELFVEGED